MKHILLNKRKQEYVGNVRTFHFFCKKVQKIIVNYTRVRYRAYTHDAMAATLVLQNNETAAMLVYQTNPVRVQLFSNVNNLFCFSKFAWMLDT